MCEWDGAANAPVEDAFWAPYQYRQYWVATYFFYLVNSLVVLFVRS